MVIKTGAIFKAFEFDGEDSRDYGIYITGEAVYNAPERSVEMISIPGRNGSYALDNGRFENITVTYPAGVFADSQTDFADAVSNLRNMLCSRKGYCRLTDEYNPSEYRLAVYKSGLEVTPETRAGEFNIVFECKPQRFLTSGETKSTITSGDTVTNPTLFESHPLLEAYGYGDINIGTETITIDNIPLGEVTVFGSGSSFASTWIDLDGDLFNTSDALTSTGAKVKYYLKGTPNASNNSFINVTLTDTNSTGITADWNVAAGSILAVNIDLPDMAFVAGTAKTYTHVCTVAATYINTVTSQTFNGAATITIIYQYRYSGGKHQIKMGASASNLSYLTNNGYGLYPRRVIADSTVSANGTPTYIDLDIGEAWILNNGSVASVNNAVSIPAELPTLSPGSNTITFDNTITQLDITPRWWKV